MKRRALAAAALATLVAVACHSSSDPVPPELPVVAPERDRAEAQGAEQELEQKPEQTAEQKPARPENARYVAPGGDDGAEGTAQAPWRTLEHAASQVEPGDTVIVRPGHYRGVWIETSGTEAEPIRFLAEEGAIIDSPNRADGINIEGASHVEIRGFHVRGAQRAGIRAVEAEGVVIRDNVVEENFKWGILTSFCDGVRIVDNEASRSEEQHGIYVASTSEKPVIRGNRLWGNRLAGLHMNGDRHLGGEGLIREARVVGNVIYENGRAGAAGINMDGVVDSLIANNLLYDNHASGIAIYKIDGGAPSTGNAIVHNTVVMPNEETRWALLLQHAATDTTLYNNIIVSQHARRGAIMATRDSLRGLASDANLVTGRFTLDGGQSVVDLDAWRELTGQDGSSRAAPAVSELFVDPEGGDFRPAPSSPALGAGKPVPRSRRGRMSDLTGSDLAGRERPRRGGRDLGCYQMSGAQVEAEAAET